MSKIRHNSLSCPAVSYSPLSLSPKQKESLIALGSLELGKVLCGHSHGHHSCYYTGIHLKSCRLAQYWGSSNCCDQHWLATANSYSRPKTMLFSRWWIILWLGLFHSRMWFFHLGKSESTNTIQEQIPGILGFRYLPGALFTVAGLISKLQVAVLCTIFSCFSKQKEPFCKM